MRGTELYRRFTPQDNAQARALFERAIDLDPRFARAYANLAATHRQDWTFAWTQDRDTSEDLAYRMAGKAVELARRELEPKPSLPHALEQLGYVLLYRKRHQEASDAAEEAVRRSPSYADGYALWAHVLIYRGKPEEALRKTQEAIDRNPKYPFFYDYHRGHAHYVWGFLTSAKDSEARRRHFEEAETHLREALRKNKNFRPARGYLVAVLSELGRNELAVNEMATLRKMGRPETFMPSFPYENQAIATRLIELWQAAEKGS
jgi:adenylate cyclase